MRLQLSLEFILYAAAGIAALAVGLGIAAAAQSAISAADNYAYWYGILGEISSHSGYYSSQFAVFVPKYFCSSVSNGSVEAATGIQVSVMNSAVCKGGSMLLRMRYSYGKYVIS
ncbi:MAG: hypothetical protein QXN59_02930 [Candidatus Micrarchaeaceae archaeon]